MLEVTVCLAMSAVILTGVTSVTISLWKSVSVYRDHSEDTAMWDNVRRMVGQDLHQSIAVTCTNSTYRIATVEHETLKYFVNQSHQLIRVRGNGGTAVVAERVTAFDLKSDGSGVMVVYLVHLDGTEDSTTVCTLAGIDKEGTAP